MDRGFVPLWRKSLDSAVFQNDGLWKLWCLILMRASHKKTWVGVKTGKGDTMVELNPGQLIFGRNSFAKALRCPPGSIPQRIDRLVGLGNIITQSNTHYSILTVCNWGAYADAMKPGKQRSQHPSNTQATPKQHIQELKTQKPLKQKYMDFVFLTDDEHRKLVEKFGEAGAAQRIDTLNNGIGSKGYKYSSHYHTILNWARREPAAPDKKPEDRTCKGPGCTKRGTSSPNGRDWFCYVHDPVRVGA